MFMARRQDACLRAMTRQLMSSPPLLITAATCRYADYAMIYLVDTCLRWSRHALRYYRLRHACRCTTPSAFIFRLSPAAADYFSCLILLP